LTVGLAVAQPNEAEAAFAEGVRLRNKPDQARAKFAEAAREYEKMRQSGCDNPDLYFVQGNAYYLSDDLPRAILTYRRGLRLDPTHRGLQTHLEEARAKVAQSSRDDLGRPPTEDRPPWLPRLRLTWWSGTAVFLAYSVSCGLLLRWFMRRTWVWLLCGGVGLAMTVALSAAFYTESRGEQQDRTKPLVVMKDDGVWLRTGDGFSYPKKYEATLPRGAEAKLRHERGEWVQIELSGGQVGWVPREYVLIDSYD